MHFLVLGVMSLGIMDFANCVICMCGLFNTHICYIMTFHYYIIVSDHTALPGVYLSDIKFMYFMSVICTGAIQIYPLHRNVLYSIHPSPVLRCFILKVTQVHEVEFQTCNGTLEHFYASLAVQPCLLL